MGGAILSKPKTIGQKIRAARTSAKLTQAALAAACGVQTTTVSRWECGAQEPSWAYLEAVARACGGRLRVDIER